MRILRPFVAVIVAIITLNAMSKVASADGTDAKAALIDRMEFLDKIITTPPAVSLDQRWLQIATIAAFESHQSDLGVMMDAYFSASAQVTYYLHADTTWHWDGSQWVVGYRTLYTYTSGNLTETLEQDFDGSVWVNTGRITMTYDGSNRVSTTTYEMWQTDHWQPLFKFVYTYNGSGLISQLIQQSWNGSAWVDQTRGTATYSGTKITSELSENWNGAMWVPDSRTLFTYSGNNLTESLDQDWNGSTWVNVNRTTNTFSGSNVTQSIYQEWNGSTWVNFDRTDFAYDGQNRETLEVNYTWISETWTYGDSDTSKYSGSQLTELVHVSASFPFTTVYRTFFTYDGAGNKIEDIYVADFNGLLQNLSRTTYGYSTSGIFDDDAAAQLPASFSMAQNYPNPFNLNTVIPYSLASDGHVRITVSNLLGQTVSTLTDAFQFAGPHTANWDGHASDGAEVASGIYFFRIQVEGQSQVRKMVLLK